MVDVNFTRNADVAQRLDECLVQFANKHYYCKTRDGTIVALYNLGRGAFRNPAKLVDVNTDDFHAFRAPEPRYINIANEGPAYLSRGFARQFKMGWSANNSTLLAPDGVKNYGFDLAHLKDKACADCLEGKYPSFAEAKEANLAFSKDFAVYWGKVYDKLFVIGTIDKKGHLKLVPELDNSLLRMRLKAAGVENVY